MRTQTLAIVLGSAVSADALAVKKMRRSEPTPETCPAKGDTLEKEPKHWEEGNLDNGNCALMMNELVKKVCGSDDDAGCKPDAEKCKPFWDDNYKADVSTAFGKLEIPDRQCRKDNTATKGNVRVGLEITAQKPDKGTCQRPLPEGNDSERKAAARENMLLNFAPLHTKKPNGKPEKETCSTLGKTCQAEKKNAEKKAKAATQAAEKAEKKKTEWEDKVQQKGDNKAEKERQNAEKATTEKEKKEQEKTAACAKCADACGGPCEATGCVAPAAEEADATEAEAPAKSEEAPTKPTTAEQAEDKGEPQKDGETLAAAAVEGAEAGDEAGKEGQSEKEGSSSSTGGEKEANATNATEETPAETPETKVATK